MAHGDPNGSPDLAQLRAALAEARRAGEPFAEAWPTLTAAFNGYMERQALEETRSAWRRAYQGEPATEGDRAACQLAAMFEAPS